MNKLPKAHKKANKARCDKRRNRQRKLLKAKTKLAMELFEQTVLVAWQYRMPYSDPATLVWRIRPDMGHLVTAKYQTHKR